MASIFAMASALFSADTQAGSGCLTTSMMLLSFREGAPPIGWSFAISEAPGPRPSGYVVARPQLRPVGRNSGPIRVEAPRPPFQRGDRPVSYEQVDPHRHSVEPGSDLFRGNAYVLQHSAKIDDHLLVNVVF